MPPSAPRRVDRRIIVLVIGTFFFIAARMAPLTFLGIYFTREVGLPLTLVGVAFLTENVARAIIAPLTGALSDRVGRRGVLIATALASAAIMPMFLWVDGPVSLIIWSLAVGAAQGGWFPTSLGLLLDLAEPRKRQSTLSINYTALSLGYTVGVLPAGLLAERGFGWLALASATSFVMIAVVLATALRGPLPFERDDAKFFASVARPLRDRVFLAFAGLAVIFPFGLGLLTLALPIYADQGGMREATIGLILGANGVLLALLAFPVNKRIEGSGPFRFLPLSAAALVAAMIAMSINPTVGPLLAAMLMLTLCEVIFSSALPTAVNQLAPRGLRGSYQGAWGLAFGLGVGASLFVAGALRDLWGWRTAWLIFAAAAAAATLGLAAGRAAFRRAADARDASATLTPPTTSSESAIRP